jgi:5-dehydro-2-deoxygluconokinase
MTPDKQRPVDLVALGRVAVDFYAEQIGSPLHQAQSFRMYLGGSPGNVAIGSTRLGLVVEMFSRVGADDLGRFLRETLEREGVGTRLLTDDPDHLSGLVILGVAPPDRFPLIFYRENCADMETRGRPSDAAVFREAKALLVTGTGLSRPETAEATLEIVRMARDAGTAIIFDVDYRPVLWGLGTKGDGETRYRHSAHVTETMGRLLPFVDLLVGTEEELKIAGGHDDIDAAIAELRNNVATTIVCKRGVAGCSVFEPGKPEQAYAGKPVDVVNVLGAGDAFLAGFLRGWLRGEPHATSAAWANANGALAVSRHGCAPAMGTFEEITWFLQQTDSRAAARSPHLARLHRRAGRIADREMLVLAFDHRIPFEREADAAGVDRSEIKRLKRWLFEGFQKAVADGAEARCALLIDPIYGLDILNEATQRGLRVGAPIEAAGSTPTTWIGEGSAYAQILSRPSRWFVKALFRLHPNQSAGVGAAQLERLKELQFACDALERDLMIEVVEPEGMHFAEGDVPRLIGDLASVGIDPRWWKVPPLSESEWRSVERAFDEAGSDAGIIILGADKSLDSFEEIFRAAAGSPRAAGFAVGRSIFGDAMKLFFRGKADRASVVEEVSGRYGQLVGLWRAKNAMAGAAR